MPAVVLRTHTSSIGPSLGRNMTSLGPRITGVPTEMSDALKLGNVRMHYS